MKPINVGLLGIGTVGGGIYTVLSRNAEEITRRAGRDIRITVVADKDTARAQGGHRAANAASPTMRFRWSTIRTSTSWSS